MPCQIVSDWHNPAGIQGTSVKTAAEALCSGNSPGTIKKASTALFPQHGCLYFPPKLPGPGLSTPCKLTRVMAVPRPDLALWVGHGVWKGEKGLGRGRNKPWLPPSVLCGRFSRSPGLEVGHTGSPDESSPESAVCLVSHAWLSSRYSGSLPATLPTLASSALPLNRPGPISLIPGWVILSSFH